MNKFTASTIQDIKGYATDFRTGTERALQKYRQRQQKAREQAMRYKDEAGYFKAQQTAAAQEARAEISSLQYGFQALVRPALDSLRDEMKDSLTKTEPEGRFYDRLRIYKEFSIQPDETEARQLVSLTKGSSLACRALNATLEATGSEYRVNTPTERSFEADLEAVAHLLDPAALPNIQTDLHAELGELYNGQPQYFATDAAGKPIDTGYRFSPATLAATTADFESRLKYLDSMESRWSGQILPSLERYQKDADKTNGENAADYAKALSDSMTTAATLEKQSSGDVEAAQALAKQQTKAAQDAAAALDYYGG